MKEALLKEVIEANQSNIKAFFHCSHRLQMNKTGVDH